MKFGADYANYIPIRSYSDLRFAIRNSEEP